MAARKLVVILTRPRDFYRNPDKDIASSMMLAVRYPEAARALANRAHTYNVELNMCKRLEAQGKVRIIAPKSIDGVSTLTKDPDKIQNLYNRAITTRPRCETSCNPAHIASAARTPLAMPYG